MQLIPTLHKTLLETLDFSEVTDKIVNDFLNQPKIRDFGFRIVVLALYDETKQVLKRTSLSKTEEAEKSKSLSAVPFENIDIPITATENLLVKCFYDQKPKLTHNWPEIFVPTLTEVQALTNQTNAGIKTSIIYAIIVKQQTIGVLIFSSVNEIESISEDLNRSLVEFVDVVGISLQNSMLFTSLEEMTKNLQDSNTKLKELDKVKDEFISIASHDLRSPLTTVKNYIWMAKNDIQKNPDKVKADLDIAEESTEHSIRLVADMLDVSRIEAGRIELSPEKLSVKQEVDLIVAELQNQANDKNINLSAGVEGDLYVKADKERFHQVITNLTGNAIKFTPQNGKVTISASKKDNFVEFIVADTGIGIRPEDLPRLFTKFGKLENGTGNPSTPGTGLGLYISKNIVELSGGNISVESLLGSGSKFIFTLPAA